MDDLLIKDKHIPQLKVSKAEIQPFQRKSAALITLLESERIIVVRPPEDRQTFAYIIIHGPHNEESIFWEKEDDKNTYMVRLPAEYTCRLALTEYRLISFDGENIDIEQLVQALNNVAENPSSLSSEAKAKLHAASRKLTDSLESPIEKTG